MAAESNLGFRGIGTFGSALDRYAITFQSGALNASSNLIPSGSYFGVNTSAMAELMLPLNSSMTNSSPTVVQGPGSSTCSLLDSMPGLKHDMGLAVEWLVEEQYILEEGLAKYSDVNGIMKYIKIAARLPDKTVRDVALRCRWLMRKRRKGEENNSGKKVNNRKDKLMESSSTMNMPSSLEEILSSHSLTVECLDQSDFFPVEVSGISSQAKHLLKQNTEAFNQIIANLSSFKVEDNIDLFHCTRNNINAVLNEMKEMPGIMSQMRPLPVCINEDLVNSIFPNTVQSSIMLGSPTGMHLKQEPR